MSDALLHLLIPKEFEVWCRPGKSPENLSVTNTPSKATCANCLTAYRMKTTGRKNRFHVSHTNRVSPK